MLDTYIPLLFVIDVQSLFTLFILTAIEKNPYELYLDKHNDFI